MAFVSLDQLVKGDIAKAGVVDIWRDGGGAVGWADGTGNKAGFVRCAIGIGRCFGDFCCCDVDVISLGFHAIIGHGDGGGVEGVGADDVSANFEICLMNFFDHLGFGEGEEVIVAFDVLVPIGKFLTTIIFFPEFVALDHGAHGAINDQDAAFAGSIQAVFADGVLALFCVFCTHDVASVFCSPSARLSEYLDTKYALLSLVNRVNFINSSATSTTRS